MTRSRRSESSSHNDRVCQTCGEDMTDYGWTKGPVLHCTGSDVAWGFRMLKDRNGNPSPEHHWKTLWPPCWSCLKPLGCGLCTTTTATEILCRRCVVWGTVEALLEHGPISNDPFGLARRGGKIAPSLSAYPASWRERYGRLPELPPPKWK
jgi:hypothetical protein